MPGQVFVAVHCWNGSCSFLPASFSSFKMLPWFIHCPDDQGFLAICHSSQFFGSQQLHVELITLTDHMECHYEKLFSYLQIKIKYLQTFIWKRRIIISFYSILFLHPNWPFGFVGFMIGFLQNGCLPFRCFSVQMILFICFPWGLPLAVSLLFARDELCSEGKYVTVGIL